MQSNAVNVPAEEKEMQNIIKQISVDMPKKRAKRLAAELEPVMNNLRPIKKTQRWWASVENILTGLKTFK